MARRNADWLAFGALAMLAAAAIGVHREGFPAARSAANNSSAVNSTTVDGAASLTGSLIQLLGPLALVLAGLVLISVVTDL
jgi:hypothetical protein